MNQVEKAERFRALHDQVFVIPNAWDLVSARLLEGLGFAAIATSSAAGSVTMGKRDGQLTRDEALAHAQLVVDATGLPVSADLQNGFGDAPEEVAETVRRAAEIGLVGCTIEDDAEGGLYDFGLSVERIAAGVEAARSLPFPFMLTARAHNFLHADALLDDAIGRLTAYEEAGADVLMAPGLPDVETVRLVCSSVGKPFNFMVGIPGKSFSVPELSAAGVRRISLATSLFRIAMTGLMSAAREVLERGTFDFVDLCVSTGEIVKVARM